MTIEVCCGGYKDAIAAYRGGADRVELCSDILYGGLTPTLGTLALTKENTDLECSCMLRCREGGFCYDGHEFAVMKKDAELFISMGCDGLVFGFLTREGFIDYEMTARMCDFIDGRCKCVFHKAFDCSKDELRAAHAALKKAGIDRILTSGRAKTALEGVSVLKELNSLGGIEIMAGGSVRSHNIKELFEKSGCNSFHTSAFEWLSDDSARSPFISFSPKKGFEDGQYMEAQESVIRDFTISARSL